ncbi:MAG: adaptor protein MecA [Clostridia bacterium]|nr:adaptor protein MecA [Clostridia bacterium]
MELILISESKLKIMLTAQDMSRYDIDAMTLDYTSDESRKAFHHILEDAKNETGFDTEGDRLFIQMYPSRSGGCELFVTKLGVLCSATEGETPNEFSIPLTGGTSVVQLKPERKSSNGPKRAGAYCFEQMEWMLRVCRRLSSCGYSGESSAYRDNDGKCYLILEEMNANLYSPLDEYSFILEYGTYENAETLRLYIREHGTVICGSGAVEKLAHI